MSNDTGKVLIHGKEYKTVALRVTEFRKDYADWSIETDIIENNDDIVIMKTLIKDEKSNVRATGYAEERRGSTNINKTSALENCETSAVGRALSFVGLAGSEIASVQEITKAELDGAYFKGIQVGAAAERHKESIEAIKTGIANEDLNSAVEAWTELTDDEKISIWVAPSKGGAFSTNERTVMKSNEWTAAMKEVFTDE